VCNGERPLPNGIFNIAGLPPQACRGSEQVPTHEGQESDHAYQVFVEPSDTNNYCL